jgi:Polyketide cyclase / dehydrase and lipid transport
MARVTVHVERQVDAPPATVLAFLRDYRSGRPRILTDNYSEYRVEAGGEGAGTVVAYRFAAGGRKRDYRLRVEEADGALHERDELSSFVGTWRVTPNGAGSQVALDAGWQGAGGIGGVFERTFAPIGLRRIFAEMLDKLAAALSA